MLETLMLDACLTLHGSRQLGLAWGLGPGPEIWGLEARGAQRPKADTSPPKP